MFRYLPLLLLSVSPLALAELQIGDAWIKDLPPSVPVRAGYMTIHNPDSGSRRIVAAASESFASVEIHESLMQDGMMRMEQRDELVIDAGATVRLEPGGLHLMMMQPKQPIKPGEVHRLSLELDDGTRLEIDMTVKK